MLARSLTANNHRIVLATLLCKQLPPTTTYHQRNLSGTKGTHHENVACKEQQQQQKESVKYKIKECSSRELFNSCNIDSGNIELDDLEISEPNGNPFSLNLTWLRDICQCNVCAHQFSRQRLSTIKDFKQDMFGIDNIEMSANHINQARNEDNQVSEHFLKIRWSDGHESNYSVNWLNHLHSLYNRPYLDLSREPAKFHLPNDDIYSSIQESKPSFWTRRDIVKQLAPVDFADLIDGFVSHEESTFINANKIYDLSKPRFEAMLSLTQQLVTFGIAKIYNVPQERDQVLKLAKSLAYERPTGYGTVFDVTIEPNEEINLAYSSLEFDLHTDLPYRETSPGVQILHCIRNSTEGGLSYFSDGYKAASILEQKFPELFKTLVQFPVTFALRDPYRGVKFRRQQQVISLDFSGNLSEIHYSPFMQPPMGYKDDVKMFYVALGKFTELLQANENKLIVKMEPGDLFIFNNRRVLHGRSSYDARTSSRLLQGCYMDWDEIRSMHEKLLSFDKSCVNQ